MAESKSELELSGLTEVISSLPGFNGFHFNPAQLVKVVNTLRQLGDERALSILANSALETGGHSGNVLLVARVLFVSRDDAGAPPRLEMGQPDLAEPSDSQLPMFPVCLRRDVPFILVGGYLAGGEALPPSVYLEWCRSEGKIRPQALVPADNPLAAVDELLDSELWKSLKPKERHFAMLRLQALRAVAHLFPRAQADQQELLSSLSSSEFWIGLQKDFESLGVFWSSAMNQYERKQPA
jgi:hypothetical protein